MADFRRWITALAVLALFAGLAAAQTGGTGVQTQMVCNSVAQVTPTLRSEGVTELTGDVLITCTGGSYGVGSGAIVPGSSTPIPQANLIITMSLPVTSRLTGNCTPSATAPCASEATLMIDEPHSGLGTVVPGFGPDAPLIVCTTPATGCLEYATNSGVGNVVVATSAPATVTPGPNVFQGVVNGNQVTFNGIPILPPVTSGINRVFRVTNIRVSVAGGGTSSAVTANLSFSGPASVPISNPSPTVGFVNSSLQTSVLNPSSVATTASNVAQFTQCNLAMGSLSSSNLVIGSANVAFLQYTEKFPSAFKTRVNAATNISGGTTTGTSYLGTSSAGGYLQNVPGALYNSESGFIVALPGISPAAGLADTGTRFQAVFANVPSGATIWVSRYNVANFTTVAPGVIAASPLGNTSTQAAAFLVSPGAPTGGYVTVNGTSIQVAPVGSNNTAIWEVVNTNTSQLETFQFAAFITYTPNLGSNQPTPTTAANQPTVTLAYNPIDPTPGTNPSSVTAIPRFVNLSTAQPLLNIVQCQTVLLFPYVTSQGGFDTGIAISNTSMDPLGPTATQTSQGTCTLNFYGAGAPTAPLTVPSSTYPTVLTFGNGSTTTPLTSPTVIPAGGQIIFTTASVVPNFQGYMFATCNFQYAHGFAFVSDVGARNLAMGYLALIVNNGIPLNGRASGSTAYAAENLNQ